jgi:hypothetical protein
LQMVPTPAITAVPADAANGVGNIPLPYDKALG